MKAKLKFQGEEIEIPDVERVNGLGKFKGLMFKSSNTNALLFDFPSLNNPSIHSLFCPDFLAIWLNQGKIVDYKLVTSGKMKVKPEKDFTQLLEIPLNNKYSSVVKFFLSTSEIRR
jgi:hypothetical protein